MIPVAPSILDRAITALAPGYGVRRYNARIALHAAGQYSGARSTRNALKAWMTRAGSADSDTLGDLETLRSRSRDLLRNNPIATGARATSRSNVVGTGLHVRAQIDRELLGMTEAQAEAWEQKAEKLFHRWAVSKAADITRHQNFYELQALVFSTVFESGDTLVLRRKAKVRAVLALALAIVEADRIVTPVEHLNDPSVRDGVRIDEDGAPVSYFVANDHPGDDVISAISGFKEVPAIGAASGEVMALHVFERVRPGLTRGVPFLAPVIETLKQLDRYSEAELMKAVVSSFFTVFMKTANDDGLASATAPLPGMASNEVTLGSGSVVELGSDESIEVAQSTANTNFDPFFLAVVRQIGVALSIPYELLVMHFTASYSASRAAIEMASQFFKERREWLVNAFCQPVYEWFIVDAVNAGLLTAPGFDDPVRRAAYLGAMWIPPSKLVLDPKKEWEAEKIAVEMGGKTLEQVVTEKTGGDWKKTTEQRGREHSLRVALKLEPETLDPNKAAGGAPEKPEPGGKTEEDQ
ncbi:hypothetical protein PMNALOAF_2750 [Methylobacterium adhaesivum]|uniref:Phage portal protein n=1 Tax=Methylobacterium adhaesivum TaxID=333297 RepID=A0ABT8BLN0_9HYPH|nr:phage portal protein [Methylobacterium adhaesivum]MDN3592103.1 phage portal protein [Methylobacterium adhaesivum]GJD31491.1 hypothetical protein PMNALOAF_2750 [Methylobacterium adhaesivum]